MQAHVDPACLWLTQGNLLNVMKGGPQKAIDFFAFDLFKARPPIQIDYTPHAESGTHVSVVCTSPHICSPLQAGLHEGLI